MSAEHIEDIEDVDSFRQRARTWIRENLRPVGMLTMSLRAVRNDEEELAESPVTARYSALLFDAGLAGLCMPREYGGQGLTPRTSTC